MRSAKALLVIVRRDIAPGEVLLDPLEEPDVDGHEVFGQPVLGTVLDHPDLAVALDDVRLDLSDLLVEKRRPVLLPADDGRAGLADAGRTQRVGLSGPAQGRLGFLPRLLERLFGPSGCERGLDVVLTDVLNGVKGDTGRVTDRRIDESERPLADGQLLRLAWDRL
jgi:hypothetical protein